METMAAVMDGVHDVAAPPAIREEAPRPSAAARRIHHGSVLFWILLAQIAWFALIGYGLYAYA
jgi:hypothetical protein